LFLSSAGFPKKPASRLVFAAAAAAAAKAVHEGHATAARNIFHLFSGEFRIVVASALLRVLGVFLILIAHWKILLLKFEL
jgi:hypothetical protein